MNSALSFAEKSYIAFSSKIIWVKHQLRKVDRAEIKQSADKHSLII